jgi:hypothetical protein
MQFFPWADGGVVKFQGRLPLEAMLLLAEVKEATHVIKYGGFQYSSVLPISEEDFRLWPSKMSPKMTNMQASLVQWQLVPMADEGTREPYVARLFPGLLEIRNKVLTSSGVRKQFDGAYEPIMKSILAARKLMKDITNELNARRRSDKFEGLLRGYIHHLFTTVQALVQVLLVFNIDIRFVLDRESEFVHGLTELRFSHAPLADYLEKAHAKWLRRFCELARLADRGEGILSTSAHEGARAEGTSPVEALRIGDKLITEFVEETFSRTASLIENTCMYAFKIMLPQSLTIREIPLSSRIPYFPRRFDTALRTKGVSVWQITYSDKTFDSE